MPLYEPQAYKPWDVYGITYIKFIVEDNEKQMSLSGKKRHITSSDTLKLEVTRSNLKPM